MRPRRVLIADDHVPTRARVRKVLERAGLVVCAEAATASGAVEAALRERPDVCLLDVHMPGNGITAAGRIAARLADTVIVMLTVSRERQDACDSMRAGAAAYLLKDMDPARMPEALEAAMRGEGQVPPLP